MLLGILKENSFSVRPPCHFEISKYKTMTEIQGHHKFIVSSIRVNRLRNGVYGSQTATTSRISMN
jgi:hypothetical protein